MERKSRLLIVEDEGIFAADLATRLERLDYVVVGTSASADEAMALATSSRPDLILMDIVLQGPLTGIGAARRIRDALDIPVIFVTSHADQATLHSALGVAPFGYVLKPFNERELQAAIEIGLYRHRVEDKLRKMERWLATTLSSIGDAVIATDIAGRIQLINPTAARLTGWTADEAIGQLLETVFRVVDVSSREPLTGLVDRVLHEGFSIALDEHLVLLSQGRPELRIDDSIEPIRDETGAATGVVVVFRDTSTRHLAQAAQREQAASLERTAQRRTTALLSDNRALTAFAAAVSHDLRAPVLAVKGLSTLLADRYASALDGDGLKLLGFLKAKSVQMERMIDGFLSLFRLRQQPMRSESVDSQSIVAGLVGAMRSRFPESGLITVDPLPMVKGDADLIRQLWANLLSNAVKFSDRSEHPTIHVSVTTSLVDGLEMAQFQVTDNGIGFDEASAGKIFDMFQRLHLGREFQGHGIGLAAVQAIVERHGGQVQAKGETGNGAAMSFSLPTAPGALT